MQREDLSTDTCTERMKVVVEHLLEKIRQSETSSVEKYRLKADVLAIFEAMVYYAYNDGYGDGYIDARESMKGAENDR